MSGRIDEQGWIRCPICGSKTRTRIYPDTELKNFPVFCPKCGHGYIVEVKKLKIISIEPDAKTQSR